MGLKDDAVIRIFDFPEHLMWKRNAWLLKLTKSSTLHVARVKRKYGSQTLLSYSKEDLISSVKLNENHCNKHFAARKTN